MPRIEIYTAPSCGYCSRAKSLLRAKKAAFTEISVRSYGRRQKMSARSGGATSVPQIFIGGKHVGGCNALHALDRAGKLDKMLNL